MKDPDNSNADINYSELARLCGVLSNPSRIALLEKLACDGSCIKDDFVELAGLSKFTVGMNLKYLKKFEMINGSLSSRSLSYCINYQKLDEFKKMFDEFYERMIINRENIEVNNCTKR